MTSNESDRKSPIEWVIGGLSGVVVLAIMLFLATQAIFSASGRPVLSISVEQVERAGQGSIVGIKVMNAGKEAASDISVSATAAEPGAGTKRLEFGYLGSGSEQRGAFVFDTPVDPRRLKVQVDGYLQP